MGRQVSLELSGPEEAKGEGGRLGWTGWTGGGAIMPLRPDILSDLEAKSVPLSTFSDFPPSLELSLIRLGISQMLL